MSDFIIKTGLERLDELTGGFLPGELVILLAQTGHGKTAFCRTILNNNPQIKAEICTPKEGEYDLLFMQADNAYFQPECQIDAYWQDCKEPWQKLIAASRYLKNHAIDTNEVVVWTVPVKYLKEAVVVVPPKGSFSALMPADFAITINRAECNDFKSLNLLKSRRGNHGKVDIYFTNGDGDYAVMKEVIKGVECIPLPSP
jgi:hypothetical protein